MDTVIIEINNLEIKKLTASSGTVLTNGETYGKEVYLGKFDSPDNWWEISEEEYLKATAEENTKE